MTGIHCRRYLGALASVIFMFGVGGAATADTVKLPVRTDTLAATPVTCLNLVPAAYGPSVWTGISAPQDRPADVIADWGGTTDNPTSGGGPGGTFSQADAKTISTASSNGVKVLGYVWTDYADSNTSYPSASITEAEAQVRAWKTWYGVTSIFLDGATNSTIQSQINYYAQLYQYIHTLSPGATVWINPGTYPLSPAYMKVADVIVDWENSSLPSSPPGWVLNYPASRFANIINSYTGNASTALAAIRADHAQYAYVASTSNYSTLPSYWPTEMSAACVSQGRRRSSHSR